MSAWRRKAIEAFPEMSRDVEGTDYSIYELFTNLLHMARQAHVENDEQVLDKVYGFAEWCVRQEDGHLRDAACTGFYEHLLDERIGLEKAVRHITRNVFDRTRSFWEWVLTKEQFTQLRAWGKLSKR